MIIKRIDSNKNKETIVKLIDIVVDGRSYRLTETVDGRLEILADDSLSVYPCVSNIVQLSTTQADKG